MKRTPEEEEEEDGVLWGYTMGKKSEEEEEETVLLFRCSFASNPTGGLLSRVKALSAALPPVSQPFRDCSLRLFRGERRRTAALFYFMCIPLVRATLHAREHLPNSKLATVMTVRELELCIN